MAEQHWHFPAYVDGHMKQDPTQGEFFKSGELSQALVRESIQNALDARVDFNDQVGIRFAWVSVPAESVRQYFESLIPRLEAISEHIRHLPNLDEVVPFLIIEDLNTTGLIGDPRVNSDTPGDENKFYYFWRNVGRSGKTGDSRGRWGLGKSVFYVISSINTFFGITVSVEDRQQLLLMGQSVLRHHQIGKQTYTPYGWYGEIDPKRREFVLPVSDQETTRQFSKILSLVRHRRAKTTGELRTGLSIAVPFPDPEINAEALIKATIDQYFYPILQRVLFVRVGSDPEGQQEIVLQSDTIDEQLSAAISDTNEQQRYTHLLDFTKWAIKLSSDSIIRLELPVKPNAAPSWNSEYIGVNQDVLLLARERFGQEGRVAFQIPVKVQLDKRGSRVEWSSFKVFIQRDEALVRAENHYIRSGITITGIRTMTTRGLRGLVVIEDEALARMLGDAENPAHTEWLKDSQNFKGKYTHGASTLIFVRDSLKRLAEQLTVVQHEVDTTLLADFFTSSKPAKRELKRNADNQTSRRGDESKMPGDDVFEAIEGRPKPLQVQSIRGGIALSADSGLLPPMVVSVELAYDVRVGNPFKRYEVADFDLANDQLHIDAEGVVIREAHENRLEFQIEDMDFHVKITGFDTRRDLKMSVKWTEAAHDPAI